MIRRRPTPRELVVTILVLSGPGLLFGCIRQTNSDSDQKTPDTECSSKSDDLPDTCGGSGVGDTSDGGPVSDGGDDTQADVQPKDGEGETGPGEETVEATVRLQTPLGSGLQGADITYDDQTAQTNSQGKATLDVDREAPFEIRAEKSGYAPHRLVGRAGSEAFTYFTFAASKSSTSQIYGSAGVTIESGKAILAVGVDTPQLQPLVGASVTIQQPHDQPITLSSSGADPDNKIEQGEQGVVSFPNVVPGNVDLSIQTPGDETCRIYPGGPPRPDIEVEADTVTVVTFICN